MSTPYSFVVFSLVSLSGSRVRTTTSCMGPTTSAGRPVLPPFSVVVVEARTRTAAPDEARSPRTVPGSVPRHTLVTTAPETVLPGAVPPPTTDSVRIRYKDTEDSGLVSLPFSDQSGVLGGDPGFLFFLSPGGWGPDGFVSGVYLHGRRKPLGTGRGGRTGATTWGPWRPRRVRGCPSHPQRRRRSDSPVTTTFLCTPDKGTRLVPDVPPDSRDTLEVKISL